MSRQKKISIILTEKISYKKELTPEQVAQFKAIQQAHPNWSLDECASEFWNSGKLPNFENDEIDEEETLDISCEIE